MNAPRRIYSRDSQLHGSAEWASRGYLRSRNFGEHGNIFLGYGLPENNKQGCYPITTNTQRHLLTAGSTRSGKLLAASIPRCMEHQGALLVLDVKDGEITHIVYRYRRDVLKRKAIIIDPFGEVSAYLGVEAESFNVMDWLDPESDDFFEDAMLIAETIISDQKATDPFWTDEARALLCGLIMYVAATIKTLLPTEKKSRDLTQVRRLLNLSPKAFGEMVGGKYVEDEEGNTQLVHPGMAQSRSELVRAAASRIMNKSPREFSGVLSTAQQNTHFLESVRIQKSLSKSTFSMEEVEKDDVDIYIVLPAGRLFNYHRFLRLLLSVSITAITRFKTKPSPPVYVYIEEAAALGRLQIILKAYSLLAGYGVQMHIVVQDFNQLLSIYKEEWQSIISNCGVIQIIGVMDIFTAEYVSKLCGDTTIESLSQSSSEKRAAFSISQSYFSSEDALHTRNLITPHEVMTMHPSAQILILANSLPVMAIKDIYFLDSRYRDKSGKPLFDIHPDYSDRPLPRAVNFTKPNANISHIVGDVFMGG